MLNLIKKYLTSLFFSSRFYWTLAAIACLFALSFLVPAMFVFIKILFYLFVTLVVLDYAILFFTRNAIVTKRELAERFSNGDENNVRIRVINQYPFRASLKIIDELPVQFQKRDFLKSITVDGNGEAELS